MTDNALDFRAWALARSRRRHPSKWTADSTPTTLTDRSPAALWRADFEVHADQHANLTTSGMWVLAPVIETALAKALPIFQLGEIGAGRHLLDTALGVTSEDHLQALRFFIIESQEHARILALVCAELGIDMLEEHWTERVFRKTRYLRGFRTEMLAVVIGGMISARIYETISDGVGDPTLSRIFGRLHSDELRHLDFHNATLPDHLARWSPSARRSIKTIWKVAAFGAAVAVSVEQRNLLRSCASNQFRFLRAISRDTATHADRLFAS